MNCLDGEFWHIFSDLTVPGRGLGLNFTRTYSSLATSQASVLGIGWTFNYGMHLAVDGAGNATVFEESGSQIVFAPTAGGGYSTSSFVVASLVKNSDGTFTLTRGDQTHYSFGADGRLAKESDRSGYTTTLTYTNGQLSSVADPGGRRLTLTYDAAGMLSAVTDPVNRTVTFAHDSAGNLTSATDVGGGRTAFAYDANHLMLTMTDPLGGVLTNVYDSSNRVVSQTDPLNRKTTFAYAAGPQTTITDPNGNVEVQSYRNNLLISTTVGSGTAQAATSTYAYDPVSLGETTVTDPNGHVSTTTFDANGNPLQQTDPLGRTTSHTYDALNDLTSTTDPLGVTTTMTYDSSGHLLTRSRPLTGTSTTATATLTYGDPNHPGDVTAVTDPDGNKTNLSYDADGNLIRTVNPVGGTATSTYDGVGRAITRVSPNGNATGAHPGAFTTTYTYNVFGQPLSVTDPLGRKTTLTYDANQNQLSVTDGNGHATTYTYNADNELIRITRADGTGLRFARDPNGNVVGQTDGLGHTTSSGFDALDRRTSTTDPLGRKTSYGYDPAGNLTTVVDAQNQTTTYRYDAANQMVGISYSDGVTPAVTLTYDADGQRTAMSDGTGSSSYTYDSLHRLVRSVNGAGAVVGYAYDPMSRLTGIVYPGGQHTVTRGYDAAGRLTSVRDWLGNVTQFGYDADGDLLTQTYPNQTSAAFTYDGADEVIGITDAAKSGQFLTLAYNRDGVGQVKAENSTAYTYDSINRLTAAAGQSYAYDAADDPTGLTTTQLNSVSNSFDAAGQLTTSQLVSDVGTDTTNFTYDARGDRVTAQTISRPNPPVVIPKTNYNVDQASRLTRISVTTKSTSTIATYSYDGSGLRASKTVGSATEPFTWDLAEPIPLMIQDATTSYVTGPGGLPLEQVVGTNTVRYYHQDQLGSTRALTDASGQVVATYTYDPYGNIAASTGNSANPLLYAGQFLDQESGLYYLRARFYDPTTAELTTADTRNPAVEPYTYAADDPTNATDPTGQLPCVLYHLPRGGKGQPPRIPPQGGYPPRVPEQPRPPYGPTDCGFPQGQNPDQGITIVQTVGPHGDIEIVVVKPDGETEPITEGKLSLLGKRLAALLAICIASGVCGEAAEIFSELLKIGNESHQCEQHFGGGGSGGSFTP